MADFISLIASILQLVDAVAKTRNYVHDFRNAPKDQRSLLLEIQSLQNLVDEPDLNRRIKNSLAPGRPSTGGFEGPLNQLKEEIQQLTKKLDKRGISKITGRLAWPLWGKEDVREGLADTERFKTSLNTWLGIKLWLAISTSSVISCSLASGLRPKARSLFGYQDGYTDIETDISSALGDYTKKQGVDHDGEARPTL
jgi:hypothetical protein